MEFLRVQGPTALVSPGHIQPGPMDCRGEVQEVENHNPTIKRLPTFNLCVFFLLSRSPHAFQAFGQGPRACLGMRFALLEAKVDHTTLIPSINLPPSFSGGGPGDDAEVHLPARHLHPAAPGGRPQVRAQLPQGRPLGHRGGEEGGVRGEAYISNLIFTHNSYTII